MNFLRSWKRSKPQAGRPIPRLRPLTTEQWSVLLQQNSFSEEVFATNVAPLLAALEKRAGKGCSKHQQFLENCDHVYFLSDLHADPSRFLLLLWKHNLVEFQFPDLQKAGNHEDKILSALDKAWATPESATTLLGGMCWKKAVERKKSAFLILGDILDGRRGHKFNIPRTEGSRISYEYLLHLILAQLRVQAHLQKDELFFCVGNHEILRAAHGPKQSEYITGADMKFLDKVSGQNTWYEPFYRSCPHFCFLFPLKKRQGERIADPRSMVYASHAELFHHKLNQAKGNYAKIRQEEKKFQQNPAGLEEQIGGNESLFLGSSESKSNSSTSTSYKRSLHLLDFSPRSRSASSLVSISDSPFWNRSFWNAYHKNELIKRPAAGIQLPKNQVISNLVCGHTVVAEGARLDHHFHINLGNFYYFIDKGLSRCFGTQNATLDWDLLRLNRNEGRFVWTVGTILTQTSAHI